jgi:POT family proton-dependent oligopeptide transporter
MNRETAPAATAEPTILGHPIGLPLLFVVEMWERFSFYGMKAILILYVVAAVTGDNPGRGWSNADGSILLGWYGGMAYLLPVIGGIIADKLIGTHHSMVVGGLLIALGHVVLGATGFGDLKHSEYGMSVFVFGLALIVVGTGHFKPTVSVMVGQLYREHDPRRDAGFAIFYMGINLGAFLGQLVCGYLGEDINWHWGFGAAAIGMLAGLGIYSLGRPFFLRGIGEAPTRNGATLWPAFMLVGIVLSLILAAAFHYRLLSNANQAVMSFVASNPVIGTAITLVVAGALATAAGAFVAVQKPGEKGPTACIFIFMMFNAIFWLAFEQAGTSLNLFAAQKTDRTLFGWETPAAWFQFVNPLCILALSPVFAWIWQSLARRNMEPTQSLKIAAGLIFLGFGYLFMVWGGKLAASGAQVSMFFLIATYFWHTVGELCLSPTGLAFVTRAAPVRFVSLLMGIWFVSSFIAHLAGGYIAATVESIEKGEIVLPWQIGGQADFFMLFVVSSVGAGLIILLLTPMLKKLLHGKE